IVFCGSHSGELRESTFRNVFETATRYGIADQLTILGYIPDADIASIYAEATALVMPTFFGPTNIPISEAWALGCPVLTSDIRGIRQQSGDAALLVDPKSADDIASGIFRLWTEDGLRQQLIQAGHRRVQGFTGEDF